METTAASDATDGPVMSVINKRLRAHRKKLNRILQMEEALSQGKSLNKEQEEVLRSKPYFVAAIDELEKLRPQLSSAVQEELQLFSTKAVSTAEKPKPSEGGDDAVGVGDLLNLLYFGSMFAVSSQSDYTSTMLRRTHERGCCLTYDYVTDDDSADLLGEKDLDLISMLSGLLISRPADSSFSHQNALQQCIEHAKLWLANSDQPIDPNSPVTYAALRERLNRIMASDYFTAMPEMKAPVEVAAAASAGNYAPVQVPVQGLEEPVTIPPQMEGSVAEQHGDKDEMAVEFQKYEEDDLQPSPTKDPKKDEAVCENPPESSDQQETVYSQFEEVEPNQRERESKDHQYAPRRNYTSRRGGRGGGRGGGRRGGSYYSNGRGGRTGGRGGGPYQNGSYYDQSGDHYPRNYYNNNRGRGGSGRGGGYSYNHPHQGGAGPRGSHDGADVGVAS
ncbi:keratin, type I cytoskeletal 9-like [Punica granatum]|uniref:Keratin, type I cytoskeletal 9-like n=1 Tax=Punica granatum TaxID=22663 RepID=A0A6P8DZP7_PUNGR|nr:keratin, type I cytoskeletal 9-like [Punica granatum]